MNPVGNKKQNGQLSERLSASGFRFTPMRPLNANDLLERLLDFNLRSVFNGHFHSFTERHAGRSLITTNRCCAISRNNHDGTPEKGYFLCTAKDGQISREFVEVKPA